jgi:hypothetical protein
MKRSPRTGMLTVIKQSFFSFGSKFVIVFAFASGVFAATPVDIFQDMESGTNGDLLTPAIMNASSRGGRSMWSVNGRMWVSTANARNLPGPVLVGGVTYSGTGGTRSWMFNDNDAKNSVACSLAGSYDKITVACYYTAGVTIPFSNQFDTNIMSGNRGFAVLQTRNDDQKGPYLRAHSCTAGWVTTFSPTQIKIVSGKTYWVNLHFDGTAGKTSVAAFDPANAFAQVGDPVIADSTPNSTMAYKIQFGRGDNHGNNPTAKTQSYFGHILVDYTNGAFPLIPHAIATTPPNEAVGRNAHGNFSNSP